MMIDGRGTGDDNWGGTVAEKRRRLSEIAKAIARLVQILRSVGRGSARTPRRQAVIVKPRKKSGKKIKLKENKIETNMRNN